MLRNDLSSYKHSTFVERAISELLVNNCINEVTCPPFVVNPLTVSVNSSGKERPVLDLRHVNIVNEALAFANNSKYMYKFDLKSGYHHIDIHEHHHFFFRIFKAVWQQN